MSLASARVFQPSKGRDPYSIAIANDSQNVPYMALETSPENGIHVSYIQRESCQPTTSRARTRGGFRLTSIAET
jgi:hypothetical protein